jgi:hypothetical protein
VELLSDEDIPATENGYPKEPPPDYRVIFGAPDLTTFFKKTRTPTQKEYEARCASFLKAGVIGALNTGNMPDAAALLDLGPQFAQATGVLADADERARKAIDLLTSPNSPIAMFALTALPLISQLMRNHEPQIKAAPDTWRAARAARKAAKAGGPPVAKTEPAFTLHLPFGRKIPVRLTTRIKVGKLLSGFRSQTSDPRELTFKVFSDPKIVKALADQGIMMHRTDEE